MQQTWVWQVADRLNVPVIITGGSYLDHLAERVYWYPGWVNKVRLGWAYRLAREPRRLWKRYSLDLMAFGGMVLKEKRPARLAPLASPGRTLRRCDLVERWSRHVQVARKSSNLMMRDP